MKNKCKLCNKAIADKTNSHIIPSFIICRNASSDGSGKRNHELVYTLSTSTSAYTGNEVPMNVFERNFDDLSDERIEKELKHNTLSKDYILCSSCEKALADYLETPYASDKADGKTAYFFWMSVIWRINRFDLLTNNIPQFMISELRKSLSLFLQAKKSKLKFDKFRQSYPFNYRILKCPGFSNNGDGSFYAEYDKSNKIYSLTLGDTFLCFDFNSKSLPKEYHYFGIEREFCLAPLNNGEKQEEARTVSKQCFNIAYQGIRDKLKFFYINNEINKIYEFWEELGRLYRMPSLEPSSPFIKRCIENIHSDEKKIGERYTDKNFAKSFAAALTEVYGIQIYRK